MRRRSFINGVGLTALSYATMGASCEQVAKWVGKAGDVAAMVAKWLKLIKAGVADFEGVSEDIREKITAGLAATEEALELVQQIGKASSSYSRGEQDEAEATLLKAYKSLYKLVESIPGFFDDTGALSSPPEGTENPRPGTPDELALEMSS